LSGGQRQRLCIAREIFRETNIIVFDEATSALDTKSENLIQTSIDNLVGKQTMIIIAHRLSTIRKCNYIYILDNGKVVQEGTWEALMHDSNLIFREMCKLQGITK
jgi:ABC-type multidrug transport system fused ATPase/permease subunit